jgi:hypothetical protein
LNTNPLLDALPEVQYHNSTHAADVTHGIHFIINNAAGRAEQGGDFKAACEFSPLNVFAAVVAAAGHDVGHPGTY